MVNVKFEIFFMCCWRIGGQWRDPHMRLNNIAISIYAYIRILYEPTLCAILCGLSPEELGAKGIRAQKVTICTLWRIGDESMALGRLLYHPFMTKICHLVRQDQGHRTTFVRPVSNIAKDLDRCALQGLTFS